MAALTPKQISQIPSLTLSELEKTNCNSVYVFNFSGSSEVSKEFPRGIINIAINDGIGNTIGVKVPITWIPVDMTTQVTKNALIANPQFRRLVAANILKVIAEDHALQILNTAEGRKESQRIHSANPQAANDFGMAPNISSGDVIAVNDVSAIVMSVVTRDDLDEEACLNILEGHEITLGPKDMEYLARSSKYTGVKDWAVQRLS